MTKINQVRRIITWGGGILCIIISLKLNATELSTICPTTSTRCQISSTYPLITNHGVFNLKGESSYEQGIYVQQNVDSFINYGEIITHDKDQKIGTYSFSLSTNVVIKTLTNYGTISGGISATNGDSKQVYMTINNFGVMKGVSTATNHTFTINNMGTINLVEENKKFHFKNGNIVLQNYAMTISENTTTFNIFDGNAKDNSHLVLDSVTSVSFADKNSKMILDFGNGFEFGAGYLFNKLVVDTSGNNALGVDLSRLIPRSDIYLISQSGDKFVVKLAPQHSAIGNIYKANIRTMNNFYLMSNAMIYPRKAQNLGKKNLSLRDSALDSANILKSYESFAYRNESINRRIQRQNKRNYNRKSQNQVQNLKENQRNLQNLAQNLAQNPHDYYFILTPFINHNLFFESGRYNLSGFDYGFLTAFSAKVAESNSLGAHFIMSYGSLSDSKDKDFIIKSLNLNLGLNYKLDLAWDMFLKARGDFFYFFNQAKTLTMFEAIKPNNLGFGASVSYGKEWDFKSGGVLGIEAGLDYQALQSSTISLHDNTYQKALYHLLYADLGVSYSKYFGNFGVNAGLGIKGNITANKLAKSQIRISNLNRNVDMVLDNDNFLGYANLGASYVLNAKNFDMEFSLAYYGNYGDRAISNAGGFEWRVLW